MSDIIWRYDVIQLLRNANRVENKASLNKYINDKDIAGYVVDRYDEARKVSNTG